MTDYPNSYHERAERTVTGRAMSVLAHLENEVRIMRGRIDRRRVDGGDSRAIASLARDLTEHVSALGVLHQLREALELDSADQAEAPPETLTAAPGVRSYDGQRSCLYCRKRARHDVAGFLACNVPEHITRALEAMTLAVARQERRRVMSASPETPDAVVELFPRPSEVAVAHVPAGAKVIVHRDGYGKASEYPADRFPMSMDADLWVTVPGDRELLGWGAAISAYYSPAGIRNGKHKRDRDVWLQAAALVERGGIAYVALERQSPYGTPVLVAVSVRQEAGSDAS